MNLIQVVIVGLVVYLVVSIAFLFTYPVTKKEIDKTTAKGVQAYAPRKKTPYFSIHKFTSGCDQAKKSLPQFILFVILSPLIFISWLLWLAFGKDKPKDFKKVYPIGAGRPTGSTTYPQDKKAAEMILETGLSPKQVFEIMRPEYYSDKVWEGLDNTEKLQAYDAFRNRIADSMENNS